MNKFEYTITIKKILEMKTLKARETVMRELLALNSTILKGWFNPQKEIVPSDIYIFKCYNKALADYTGHNLPLFLQNIGRTSIKSMFNEAVKLEVPYSVLCDIFEFVDTIDMNSKTINEFIPKFNTIIKDNKIPFTLLYKLRVSHKYSTLEDSGRYVHQERLQGLQRIAGLLEVETIKQTLPTDIEHTVIEDMLDLLYTEDTTPISKLADDVAKWTRAIQTIKQRIAK